MRYDTGFELGLIAFTAAVLGGIGNLTGAVLGALMIGFIQAFNEGLSWSTPGSDWTRSIVFGILILILVFRPEGLLGEQTPEGADGRPGRLADYGCCGSLPAALIILVLIYPKYVDSLQRLAADRGLRPVGQLDGDHDRLHDDGRRAEHRRRLRGAARPRVRRLLAAGAYIAAWFASQQFDQWTFHFGAVGISE